MNTTKKLIYEEGLDRYETIARNIDDTVLYDVTTKAIITKIVYAVDGRNAWWNVWVSRYYPKSYSLNLEFAKNSIEKWRVQGSTWTIREVPAIAFIGSNAALVITEINTQNILSRYAFDTKPSPFINSLASYFEPTNSDNVIRLITKNISALSAAIKFNSYKAHSKGSGYKFCWTAHERNDIYFNTIQQWQYRFKEIFAGKCFFGILYRPHKIGIEITKVLSGSPAETAGIQEGDIVQDIENLENKKRY